MDDLLKELRESKNGWCGCCEAAADEIMNLRARIARLEGAYDEVTAKADEEPLPYCRRCNFGCLRCNGAR